MILERLIELRDRQLKKGGGLTVAYHKRQPVKWILAIKSDGTFSDFVVTGTKKSEFVQLETPYAKRTSAILPLLLADKLEYVLGDCSKTNHRHEAFRQLAIDCAKQCDLDLLRSYAAFLENPVELEKAQQKAIKYEIAPTELLVPSVDGTILTKLPEVQEYWKKLQDAGAAESSEFEANCMICGQRKPIARTHPVELLVGADRVGMVTANSDAFLSYGLRQSEIAPMCQGCARGYGEGLNYLLRNENHCLRMEGLTWVFWTREEEKFNIMKMVSNPPMAEVKLLLQAAQQGNIPNNDPHEKKDKYDAFYAMALSSNKSRLIVRSWLSISLKEVKQNLVAYFKRQQIVSRNGDDYAFDLRSLTGSTVRKLKDIPRETTSAFIMNAICGTPLPLRLLHQAIIRARAEPENIMTRPRAALIKMVLLSNNFKNLYTEEIMPGLNPEHPHPAYHCGRLLSLINDVQQKAIGSDSTVVSKFYGAASTSPAIIFGNLLGKLQYHLDKLLGNKETKGLAIYWDRKIEEVIAKIVFFPSTLSLPEQGLFALGFYHQKEFQRGETTKKQSKQKEESQEQ